MVGMHLLHYILQQTEDKYHHSVCIQIHANPHKYYTSMQCRQKKMYKRLEVYFPSESISHRLVLRDDGIYYIDLTDWAAETVGITKPKTFIYNYILCTTVHFICTMYIERNKNQFQI